MRTTKEIKEILTAYDLTHSIQSAAALVGRDHHILRGMCAFLMQVN